MLLYLVIDAADYFCREAAFHETAEHADDAAAGALETAAKEAGAVMVHAHDVLDACPDVCRNAGLVVEDAADGALGTAGQLGDFHDVQRLL